MPLVMEPDAAFDPGDVGASGAEAAMCEANCVPQEVKKSQLVTHPYATV
jgi:hypothetical protein